MSCDYKRKIKNLSPLESSFRNDIAQTMIVDDFSFPENSHGSGLSGNFQGWNFPLLLQSNWKSIQSNPSPNHDAFGKLREKFDTFQSPTDKMPVISSNFPQRGGGGGWRPRRIASIFSPRRDAFCFSEGCICMPVTLKTIFSPPSPFPQETVVMSGDGGEEEAKKEITPYALNCLMRMRNLFCFRVPLFPFVYDFLYTPPPSLHLDNSGTVALVFGWNTNF